MVHSREARGGVGRTATTTRRRIEAVRSSQLLRACRSSGDTVLVHSVAERGVGEVEAAFAPVQVTADRRPQKKPRCKVWSGHDPATHAAPR